MTKYVIGAVGSLLGALGGAWLILAPFALAYQPSGADWIDATFTDFWTGLPLLVVSLVGFAAYAAGVFAELRLRGLVREPRAEGMPEAPSGASTSGGIQADTEQLLVPLVAAMLKDMQDREKERGNGGAPGTTTSPDARQTLPTGGEIERSVQ